MRKNLFFSLISIFISISALAQNNEIYGTAILGENTMIGTYGTFSGYYTRSLTDRVDVMGGLNMSTKNPAGFGGLMADGSYRLPVNRANLYFSGRAVYNYYGDSHVNELLFRLAAKWETRYIDIIFGNSFLSYYYKGSSVFEPITWCVGFGANLKPRENPWNFGLFLRNYDGFVYENWILFYGLKGYYDVNSKVRLNAEFVVHPAGSINQLATKYEGFLKFGVKYKW